MLVDKKSLHRLLVELPQIKLAYLIGSYVNKRQRRDSDIDLVLVVDKDGISSLDYGELYLKVSKSVKHPRLDLRLVIPSQANPVFLHEIVNKGVLLYEREKGDRVEFEVKSMKYYYDTAYLRRIFNSALRRSFKNHTYGYR